jgi:DNA-binding XRE family transcriptional regulator
MNIKCRLRVIFAEREIKQTEFAKKVGISAGALSALVNGHSLPTLEVAYKIAELLDLPVEQVWVREKE